MKTWVKLYTEIIDDPDMASLSWAHRGVWSAFLALAGKLDARDDDELETGELADIGRVAWYLRCTTDELSDAVAEFTKRGMVDERDGVLFLTNYAKRQKRAPSAAPSAVAGRVREWREEARRGNGECNADVTTLHPSHTEDETSALQSRNAPREEESRIDTESDSDTDKIRVDAEEKSAPASAFVAQARRQFESSIGLFSPMLADQVDDMLGELESKGLQDWWALALRESEAQNKRSWAYVRAILERCLKEGKPPGARTRDAPPKLKKLPGGAVIVPSGVGHG